MATVAKVIIARNTTDAIQQVNDYLLTLVNPIIRKIDLSINDAPSRVNTDWRITIQTETGGAAGAGTWLAQAVQATSPGNLQTAINNAFTAIGAGFIGGVEMDSLDDGLSGKQPFYAAVFLYNATNNANTVANYDLR